MSAWRGCWQDREGGRNVRQTAEGGGPGPRQCLGAKAERRAIPGGCTCRILPPAGRPGGRDKFSLSKPKARAPGVTATEHCAGHVLPFPTLDSRASAGGRDQVLHTLAQGASLGRRPPPPTSPQLLGFKPSLVYTHLLPFCRLKKCSLSDDPPCTGPGLLILGQNVTHRYGV